MGGAAGQHWPREYSPASPASRRWMEILESQVSKFMLWILIAMTATGILVGCRFKAQAAVAFSVMILFIMIAVSAYQGWSLGISA
jgi:hypothetical protein